MYFELLPFFVV